MIDTRKFSIPLGLLEAKHVVPYRAIEGVLRALERLKIIPTSLDYSTIWERVRNMDIKFPEANDRLEADATGISTNTVSYTHLTLPTNREV